MRTIVSKFGGSSTANSDCFHRILDLVRASPARRCVVLSAPGIDASHDVKSTEMLQRCWNARRDGAALCRSVLEVTERFCGLAEQLCIPDCRDVIRREIEGAVEISREHTLSRGEYLCALLFSKWSGIPMLDAAELIAFKSGALDEERTARQFVRAFDRYGRFVMPGFYGRDDDGSIRVFPRNGSDISGAIAAACLEAKLYENWTDVPGLMSADPAIVPEAVLIPQVSYRQMRMLARAGAQVLHPACLDPVAMAGIPTRLRCLSDIGCFGTLIDDHVAGQARCIAGRKDAGAETACIRLFGFEREQIADACKGIGAHRLEMTGDGAMISVDPDRFERTMRLLHRRLIPK